MKSSGLTRQLHCPGGPRRSHLVRRLHHGRRDLPVQTWRTPCKSALIYSCMILPAVLCIDGSMPRPEAVSLLAAILMSNVKPRSQDVFV